MSEFGTFLLCTEAHANSSGPPKRVDMVSWMRSIQNNGDLSAFEKIWRQICLEFN